MSDIKSYEPLWGSWYVDSLIGEGSFGKVYKVKKTEFGQDYYAAVKIITIPQNDADLRLMRGEGMDEASARSYFHAFVSDIIQEINLMSQFRGNSNIVSFEDHKVIEHEGKIGWDILIRMELLRSLTDYSTDNPLSQEEVIKLGIHICKALELCALKKTIHRDIKPDNVFVSEYGDYKLGDFGIARQIERTMSGLSKKGTYTYMAPEVFKGAEYGANVDIYSLGIMMYRFLNKNRTPFLPDFPTPIMPTDRDTALQRRMNGEPLPLIMDISEPLNNIVLRACSYDRKKRFTSPLEMREALEAVSDEKTYDAPMLTDVETKHISTSDETAKTSGVFTDTDTSELTSKTVGVFSHTSFEPSVSQSVSVPKSEPVPEPTKIPKPTKKINTKIITMSVGILIVAAVAFAIIGLMKQGMNPGYKVTILYAVNSENPSQEEMNAAISLLRLRLDRENYNDSTIEQIGSNRIRVEITGLTEADVVSAGGESVENEQYAKIQSLAETIAKTKLLYFTDEEGNILLTGAEIANAKKRSHDGIIGMELQFTDRGSKLFEQVTTDNIGKMIYFFIDGELISSQTINEKISGGNIVIESNFTDAYADELLSYIRDGLLPFSLNVISVSISSGIEDESTNKKTNISPNAITSTPTPDLSPWKLAYIDVILEAQKYANGSLSAESAGEQYPNKISYFALGDINSDGIPELFIHGDQDIVDIEELDRIFTLNGDRAEKVFQGYIDTMREVVDLNGRREIWFRENLYTIYDGYRTTLQDNWYKITDKMLLNTNFSNEAIAMTCVYDPTVGGRNENRKYYVSGKEVNYISEYQPLLSSVWNAERYDVWQFGKGDNSDLDTEDCIRFFARYEEQFQTVPTSTPKSLTDSTIEIREENPVTNNVINFPDPNFEEAVRKDIGKSTGEITQNDVAKVTMLRVSDSNITDLAGIEYFTELETLICSGNKLTNMDVSKNIALTGLYCDENQLTVLDVSKNTALTALSCTFNQLKVLDVSKNTALTKLWCSHNQLTTLDVSKNTALTEFDCSHNQLTVLDISKNTTIETMWCNNNNFPNISAIIGYDNTPLTFYPQN